MSIVTTQTGDKSITVTVVIPLPSVANLNLPISFPPDLGDIKIPGLSKAIKGLEKTLAYLEKVLEKVYRLIPQASIRLVIKVGSITIIDTTLATPL